MKYLKKSVQKHIFKYSSIGEDAVTGQEYYKGAQIIENVLQMNEPNICLE